MTNQGTLAIGLNSEDGESRVKTDWWDEDGECRDNKLASLEARLVRNSAHPLTHLLTYSLTGVKCRATSVAKNTDNWILQNIDIDIDKAILEDIDKDILENIDIDKEIESIRIWYIKQGYQRAPSRP